MGNPTNPNRVVRVKDLDRFKEKLEEQGDAVIPASEQTCADIIDELT